MSFSSEKWICCQLGAREHYAVPRVLHSINRLGGLITEGWVPPYHPYRGINRLGERFNSELNAAQIYSWNTATITFELSARLRGLKGWPLTLKRNNWFQRRGVKALNALVHQVKLNQANITLFAYSYAAHELFLFAKSRGWRTILGQIDGALCEEELIAFENQKHLDLKSNWQPAPSEYWDNWRSECSLADIIIVNSEWSKTLVSKAGIDSSKLQTIPVAYEPDASAQRFERKYPVKFNEARPMRALFLGSFIIRKGSAALLEAIEMLQNEPIEFWIVGSAGITPPVRIRESKKVKWFGPVSRENTSVYYRNADLFIFPTLSDGFGMTQVEARAWKLPVISSPFCPPIIKPDVNGVVIPDVTAENLRDAILGLLYNPDKLARLSKGSFEEYQDYSKSNVRNKILSLIRE